MNGADSGQGRARETACSCCAMWRERAQTTATQDTGNRSEREEQEERHAATKQQGTIAQASRFPSPGSGASGGSVRVRRGQLLTPGLST